MVARILGLSRWGGPISAYMELTGEPDSTPRNTAMSRGVALEESVLAMWCERWEGCIERTAKICTDAMPHAHASLDGFWLPPWLARVVVDAKTASLQEMGDDWGPDGSDRLPADYHLQGLWYLGVCKAAGMNVADEALFPALVGPEAELQWAARLVTKTGRSLALSDLDGTGLELRTYRVAWDAALFEEVNCKVLAFLREHVEPRRPPQPTEADLLERDVRAVARGLKAEEGRALDFERLGPPEQAVVLEALEAARERRRWEALEEQASARVRLLMGGAEELHGLPGGARVTWKARTDGVRVFKFNEPRRK